MKLSRTFLSLSHSPLFINILHIQYLSCSFFLYLSLRQIIKHLPCTPTMDRRPDPNHLDAAPTQPYKGYELSGKIMLSAIIILFFVVILMVCLHLYARWYLLPARRRHVRRNRRNRRAHIVFQEDAAIAGTAAPNHGLDASILNSLPVFVYSSKSSQMVPFRPQPIVECAVCLSEFEDDETGRLLPKCKHSFHIECIDMWFHSHSTCPLCRAPVEPGPESETRADVVLNVCDPDEPGPSSDLCSECCNSETASSGARRKPSNIVIPRRNESLGKGEGSECGESPAGQSFRSPMSRMLSFRTMLSREKRNGGVSPSGGNGGSSSSVAGSDIELGGRQGTSECARRE